MFKDEKEDVVLMAIGYEWECQICDMLNKLIDIPKCNTVTCQECNETFNLDRFSSEHCYE